MPPDQSFPDAPLEIRRAAPADAGRLVELLALAFHDDPTWSWAFPDPARRTAQHRRLWALFVHSALPHRSVWMAVDGGAAAVWIPPGCPELTDADAALIEPLLRETVGAHADAVLTLFERFEAHHPHHQPHYYLSLLATHPDHRGHGKGMRLLAANLAAIDEQGLPAYLESSNRANDFRYQRLGFELIGEFAAPGGPTVGCMWRAPRGLTSRSSPARTV